MSMSEIRTTMYNEHTIKELKNIGVPEIKLKAQKIMSGIRNIKECF